MTVRDFPFHKIDVILGMNELLIDYHNNTVRRSPYHDVTLVPTRMKGNGSANGRIT